MNLNNAPLGKLDIKIKEKPKPVATEVETIENTAPFEVINPAESTGNWYFITDAALQVEFMEHNKLNIVTSLQNLNEDVASSLRRMGNKVTVVAQHKELDLDICDSLCAQRFLVSVQYGVDPQAYPEFLLWHYLHPDNLLNDDRTQAIDSICNHVSYFSSALEREFMAKKLAALVKISKATIVQQINSFITVREKDTVQHVEEGEGALPAWINEERYWKLGFDWKVEGLATGIYFSTCNGPKRLTNFVFSPLVHVYTKDENKNRRFTEINNGHSKTVLELPSKAFTSMEFFDAVVTSEGAFFTYDGFTKSHLNKLKTYFLGEYPKCYELNTLGWQPEGFFSFSNLIYNGFPVEYNSYGYANVNGTNYLSMGASSTLEGVRDEDNIYKNDKYLTYTPAPVSFTKWCGLMLSVYPEHGIMGIAFAIMALFKDVLFKRNNNFPMLYAYGAVQAGKSKFAESVCNLFTNDMPMFNLNQGTDFAFFSLLGMFRNVAIGLNEFDETGIKPEWFRALKGAYDGEGRSKGSGTQGKTKKQDINAAIILIGQYLSTKDDNSVLSRTLPCKFTENNARTKEQVKQYDELKTLEKKGISGIICELLEHRQFFCDNYLVRFNDISNKLKESFAADGLQPKNRIMENYTAALASLHLISEKIAIGFSYDYFFKYCKKQIASLNTTMSETNTLSDFWKIVEMMLDQHIIEQGFHYRIKVEKEVRLNVGPKQVQTKEFTEPKKILFVRMGTIHHLYAKEKKNITGKEGQNEATIMTYLKDQEYYIGHNPGISFTDSKGMSTNTSSYVFDYDKMNVNLERYKEDAAAPITTITGKVWRDAEIVDVINTPKLKFNLMQDDSYTDKQTGHQVKKQVLTTCMSDLLAQATFLKHGREVTLVGSLNIATRGDVVFRSMAVTEIIFNDAAVPVGNVENVF